MCGMTATTATETPVISESSPALCRALSFLKSVHLHLCVMSEWLRAEFGYHSI